MWLITTFGFFSVVQKPWDRDARTLTVRARVAADLDALRTRYLPELGPTVERHNTDYRFRAQAPAEAVARAMTQAVRDIDYHNFKSEVGKRQGHDRATLYGDVWRTLDKLQEG